MNLIEKLENAINKLLILLGDFVVRFCAKIIPVKIQVFWSKVKNWMRLAIIWCKALPKRLISAAPLLLNKLKGSLLSYNYKEKLQQTYQAAMAQYKQQQAGKKLSTIKTALLAPFLIIGQWLKGLSAIQSLMLLGFTAASILAAINIVFSGHRLMENHMQGARAPASAEEEAAYERPDYYKKETRHLDFTNLRLPVYFANVNELRSIDIDFNVTLSNRNSRMQLSKLEFQLRDHLILNVEPMIASFPLVEEGKEILRQKLLIEINQFMKERKIEGEVQELKLIYILAN